VQFEDLKTLFRFNRINAFMNILEDYVLYVLFLHLQQPINISKLLIRISLKLIYSVFVVISKTVFHKQNCPVNINSYYRLKVLCNLTLETFVSIFIIDSSIFCLGFLK